MKVKKSFENLIRGWLPKEQGIRHHPNNSPIIENTKVLLKPNSPMLDVGFQRNFGIALWLGLGVILVGLMGWMSVNQTYNPLTNYFSYVGLDASIYYLFNDLIEQKAFFLMLIAIGVFAALLSVLIFKKLCYARTLFKQWTACSAR